MVTVSAQARGGNGAEADPYSEAKVVNLKVDVPVTAPEAFTEYGFQLFGDDFKPAWFRWVRATYLKKD